MKAYVEAKYVEISNNREKKPIMAKTQLENGLHGDIFMFQMKN